MKDVYLMNKETGELVPSAEVFRTFWNTPRGPFASVFDEWEETGLEVEGTYIAPPNFAAAVAI